MPFTTGMGPTEQVDGGIYLNNQDFQREAKHSPTDTQNADNCDQSLSSS